MSYVISLSTSLIAVLFTSTAFACDCKGPKKNDSTSVAEAFAKAHIVAVALVNEIILHEDSNMVSNYRAVSMIVQDAYKGTKSRDTLTVIAYIGERSCGYELKKGITYLLYAYQDEQHGLKTDSCTRTTIFTSAVYDPVILRKFNAIGATPVRLE